MNKTSLCFSVAAFALSLFSLYEVWMNPTKDQSSNLIATLGIICTVLIGWQIFSLINLFQYEKRMKNLESDIESTKSNLDTTIKNSCRMQHLADGLQYHALADIYKSIGKSSIDNKEELLVKEISWLMAELEVCLYSNNLYEFQRTKNNIVERINSNNVDLEPLNMRWKSALSRFHKSGYPLSREIFEEIEKVNQLFENPR